MPRKQPPGKDATARRFAPAVPPKQDTGDASNQATGDESSERERGIDETLEESFPSSDPPSWTLGR